MQHLAGMQDQRTLGFPHKRLVDALVGGARQVEREQLVVDLERDGQVRRRIVGVALDAKFVDQNDLAVTRPQKVLRARDDGTGRT